MEKSISIERTRLSKPKPDQTQLGFGKYFTDHMFIMDYSTDKGWFDPRIVPYAPLRLDTLPPWSSTTGRLFLRD